MNYGSSMSSWKPWRWVRLDLTLSMRNIYIDSNLKPLTKFTSSSRGTEFKDIIPWNMKTISISTRIVINNAMKQDILLWMWWEVNGNWDNNMIRTSPWREGHCRTNTSVRRKKFKRAGLWEPQSGIQVGKLTIWVRSFENYNRVHQVDQFYQNR